MKFKLVENIDYEDFSYGILSQYLYDAVDELKNSSLERYIEWFRDNIPDQDKPHEELFVTCVRDAYIDLVDSGKINREKTMITSRLKEYIESHADIIEDLAELMKQCPSHLQYELTLVLDKIDDPLNESLFDDARYWNSPYDHAVFKYINENPDLVNDIETLYQRCSKYLKPSLVKILDHAEVVDSLSVKRAKYLLKTYDPLVLINVIRDKDDTFRGNSAFDALEYGVSHWEELFSDITLSESLNEELLTEATRAPKRIIYEARFDTPDAKDAIEIFSDDYDKFKELLDKYRRRIKTVTNITVHLLKFVKKTYKFPDIEAPFTVSDANQLDSYVPQSFRKSIDDNKVDITNNKQKRLLDIWERNHYTDGKIEPVDRYHSKITFE